MKELVEVFKVSFLENGQTWGSHFPGVSSVQYQTGKVVTPIEGNGPLTAFRTYEAAEKYAKGMYFDGTEYVIYSCEAEESNETAVWAHNRYGEIYHRESPWPLNRTILCDAIIPIEILAKGKDAEIHKVK